MSPARRPSQSTAHEECPCPSRRFPRVLLRQNGNLRTLERMESLLTRRRTCPRSTVLSFLPRPPPVQLTLNTVNSARLLVLTPCEGRLYLVQNTRRVVLVIMEYMNINTSTVLDTASGKNSRCACNTDETLVAVTAGKKYEFLLTDCRESRDHGTVGVWVNLYSGSTRSSYSYR